MANPNEDEVDMSKLATKTTMNTLPPSTAKSRGVSSDPQSVAPASEVRAAGPTREWHGATKAEFDAAWCSRCASGGRHATTR